MNWQEFRTLVIHLYKPPPPPEPDVTPIEVRQDAERRRDALLKRLADVLNRFLVSAG